MRYIYRHILTRSMRLLVYLFAYIIASFLIILAFGGVYNLNGIEFREAVSISFHLFYGIESNYKAISSGTIAFEYIIRDVIFITWVGGSLSKLLSPVNPIYFADYFTCNKEENGQRKTTFRYWLMLKSGQFLYDVEIRVFIQDTSRPPGRNHIATLWEWNSEDQHLSLARGIRYIDIIDNGELLNLISKKGQVVTVMIRGIDEDGKVFYRARSYSKKDCHQEQQFVSILKTIYCKQLGLKDYSPTYPWVQFDYFNQTTVEEKKPSRKRIQNKWFSFWLYMDTPCWERIRQKLKKMTSKRPNSNYPTMLIQIVIAYNYSLMLSTGGSPCVLCWMFDEKKQLKWCPPKMSTTKTTSHPHYG